MVLGHSSPTSSSSRPFLFGQYDPLITTTAIGSAWDDLQLNRLQEFVGTYDLEDLLSHFHFSARHDPEVKHPICREGSCHPIAWVKSLITSACQRRRLSGLSYSADMPLRMDWCHFCGPPKTALMEWYSVIFNAMEKIGTYLFLF